MIAVTGATGRLGRLVVEDLLEREVPPERIAALARAPERASDLAERGVEVRQADYDRPETLGSALRGVKKLLLVSSSEPGRRLDQHGSVVEAAKQAGVGLLLYTSILHADTSGVSLATEHLETERLIRESGVPHLVLRNGWYLENYTEDLDQVVESGTIYGAAGAGRVAAASRADYAGAAAVLLTGDHGSDRVFELCGDASFSYDELAAAIGEVAGTDVVYQDMDPDAYREALVQSGLPLPVAAMLADADEGVARGDLDSDSTDLRDLLGRPTTTLEETLREAVM
jgi:NAD(P)H dehydrogenase (quinone)